MRKPPKNLDTAPRYCACGCGKILIAEWGLIAQSIAQQCKWRPQGKCLLHCQGMAVCNLDGLTLVDPQGRSVEVAQASSGTGVPPVDPKP
jgi:hypothetical protein